MNRAELNKAHTKIFESVTEVHSITGPGLPLHVYRSCLLHELRLKGLMYKRDVVFPVIYKDYKASEILIELIVENSIIVDLINEEKISTICLASMQSRLKITGLRMGIIITFNTLSIIDGYRKILVTQY
ncbi:MAG TPA: GxxExxY protein [Lentimicrobium sp.]|nr:GxxExxY protein [Lentimicrobium sp.]